MTVDDSCRWQRRRPGWEGHGGRAPGGEGLTLRPSLALLAERLMCLRPWVWGLYGQQGADVLMKKNKMKNYPEVWLYSNSVVPQSLKKKKKIISRVYLFHGWKSGEQDVRAVCQLSGREITNSFISEVREPGLLLSKNIASWRKHCRHKEERDSAALSWQVAHLILFFNWFLSWRLLVSFLPRSLKLASCMIIESH